MIMPLLTGETESRGRQMEDEALVYRMCAVSLAFCQGPFRPDLSAPPRHSRTSHFPWSNSTGSGFVIFQAAASALFFLPLANLTHPPESSSNVSFVAFSLAPSLQAE